MSLGHFALCCCRKLYGVWTLSELSEFPISGVTVKCNILVRGPQIWRCLGLESLIQGTAAKLAAENENVPALDTDVIRHKLVGNANALQTKPFGV